MDHTSDILKKFKNRKLSIVLDDSDGLGRAVLVAPASTLSSSDLNDMLNVSGSHVYVSISESRAAKFSLLKMNRNLSPSSEPVEPYYPLTTTVDAREGITTGISTEDRALCVQILAEADPQPSKLVKPGHIFPVAVKNDGILVKPMLPEAARDLVRLADMGSTACFMDLFNQQGTPLSEVERNDLISQLELPMISISELTKLRLESELLVSKVAEAKLPTKEAGMLRSCIYKAQGYGGEHLALIKGTIKKDEPVLTRVQTESTLDDVFGSGEHSSRCVLQNSLRAINQHGSGVLLYLRKPSTGHVVDHASSAAAMREYGIGAQILYDLGVRKIALISNSKKKLVGLQAFDIEIVSQHSVSDLLEKGA